MDYELICPKCGEDLRNGECEKCGYSKQASGPGVGE
jgi:hypothetical protein